MIKTRIPLLEYFILFLLIAQAGFPFFVGNKILIIFFVITLFAFALKGYTVNNFIMKYILAFIFLMVAQFITTGNFLLSPFLGILLRIFYAYIAIKLIGPNFQKYYIKFMYFFTITSMFFWVLLAFIPGMYNIFSDFSNNYIKPLALFPEFVRQNIIIYTNDYWLLGPIPKNAGPFWEPGAFGVFLNLAILFNTMEMGTIINKKNILFIVALITTYSFGSYAAFFVFVFAYIFFIKKIINLQSILAFVLLLYIGFYSYSNFSFLGEKFEKRYQSMKKFNTNLTYSDVYFRVGRNEQAILDINSFIHHPIFGEGQFIEYEYGASASGLTVILRKWGIIGFFLIFGVMYLSFKKFVEFNNLPKGLIKVSLLTIMAVTATQGLFGKVFFLGLIFTYLIFDKYKIQNAKVIKKVAKVYN